MRHEHDSAVMGIVSGMSTSFKSKRGGVASNWKAKTWRRAGNLNLKSLNVTSDYARAHNAGTDGDAHGKPNNKSKNE